MLCILNSHKFNVVVIALDKNCPLQHLIQQQLQGFTNFHVFSC